MARLGWDALLPWELERARHRVSTETPTGSVQDRALPERGDRDWLIG